jgi:hypothetical protein
VTSKAHHRIDIATLNSQQAMNSSKSITVKGRNQTIQESLGSADSQKKGHSGISLAPLQTRGRNNSIIGNWQNSAIHSGSINILREPRASSQLSMYPK